MAKRTPSLINQIGRDLPEGLVVDAAWLGERGISSSLRAYYVKAGWLEQPVRGVYRRPRGTLSWEQVVISLQTILLKTPLVVGGRTALELQGLAHYLSPEAKVVHLYGPDRPLGWLQKLKLPQQFVFHNSRRLFRGEQATICPGSIDFSGLSDGVHHRSLISGRSVTALSWGQWNWPLTISRPERAVLELLDELPHRESFHQADVIIQGAANLSPRLVQALLEDCDSVKAKRLFFFFADRHGHAWLKHLDKEAVDLGAGKRMLVPGGRLDPDYLITVPKELYDRS